VVTPPIRFTVVAGTRPNFVKLAPLLDVISDQAAIDLVHTGQHYDRSMSQVFFEELGIPAPQANLDVGSDLPGRQTAEVMIRFEARLMEHRADAVVVIGDVNSTLAAALVAAKLHVPVAHIEAGVRSRDLSIPEEVNRVLTDHVSRWLFTPTEHDSGNLRNESIADDRIFFVGNIAIDTLFKRLPQARKRSAAIRETFDLTGAYGVLTLHRPSNVDEPQRLEGMLDAIGEIGIPILFPIHPRTRNRLLARGFTFPGSFRVTEPLGYVDFLGAVADASVVVTDSGGLQAETGVLGVPCVTVFDSTAWPITIDAGTNRIAGTDPKSVVRAIREALTGSPPAANFPKWDGRTSDRIAAVLLDEFS
jgi:UDP-N-acetylglucosamine 2-epimerase (non-hydrolysing)